MSRPVITRRCAVAGGGAAVGAAVLLIGVTRVLAVKTPPKAAAAFDPAAFLADLDAAGCKAVLITPGTCFDPSDEASTYFIRPSRGYTAVMARWWTAMDACHDAHERVVATLAERGGWVL